MQNKNNKLDEKHNVLKPSPGEGEGGEWRLQSGVACSYIYNNIIFIIIINIYIAVSLFVGGGGGVGACVLWGKLKVSPPPPSHCVKL